MDYHEMIRRIRRLDFIRDEQRAEEAARAVLGVLASALSEEQAAKITGKFAGALPATRTGGDQVRSAAVSVADYIASMRTEYNITGHQARLLLRNVLYFTKQASGDSVLSEISRALPQDWAEAIQKA